MLVRLRFLPCRSMAHAPSENRGMEPIHPERNAKRFHPERCHATYVASLPYCEFPQLRGHLIASSLSSCLDLGLSQRSIIALVT